MIMRALACLGLANLLLLSEWDNLYTLYRADRAYFADREFPLVYLWSTALAVLIVAAAFAMGSLAIEAASRGARTMSGRARPLLAASAFIALEVWLSASVRIVDEPARLLVALAVMTLAIVWVVYVPRQAVLRSACKLLAWTAVLFPVFLTTTLAGWARASPVSSARVVDERRSRDTATNRLVWIVFDELDERVAFGRRPSSLKLPAFDRLRRESLVATSAYAPGSWTLDALSTLWVGRPVAEAIEEGPSALRLTYADDQETRVLEASATVFGQVRDAGRGIGLVGWYHPYCRLFGSMTDRCEAAAAPGAFGSFGRARLAEELGAPSMAARLIIWHAPWSTEAIVTGGFPRARLNAEQALVIRQRAEMYRRLHAAALEMVLDRSLSLVFVHQVVPHLPGFYDADRADFDVSGLGDYFDNLTLADRALAEIRASLEAAGLWDETAVIVQADHALRPDVWIRQRLWTAELEALTDGQQGPLVPFFVKLPGQRDGVEYHPPFNAALAHDLALELIDGTLGSPAEVRLWLDTNRERLPLSWSVRTIAERELGR